MGIIEKKIILLKNMNMLDIFYVIRPCRIIENEFSLNLKEKFINYFLMQRASFVRLTCKYKYVFEFTRALYSTHGAKSYLFIEIFSCRI